MDWEALIPDAFAAQFGKPVAQAEDGRVRVQGQTSMCR